MGKKYKELLDQLDGILASKREKGDNSHGRYSESNLTEMTKTLLNDPSYVLEEISWKDGKEKKELVSPSKEFREAIMSDVSKCYGIDSGDSVKFNDFPLSTKTAAALNKVAFTAQKDSMTHGGRKFTFPANNSNEASMSIYTQKIPTKVFNARSISKDSDGNYTSEKTGNVTIRKEHFAMKAENKLPANLKEIKKA